MVHLMNSLFKSDYKVQISDHNIVKLTNKHIDLTYFLALEPYSVSDKRPNTNRINLDHYWR